MGRTRDAILEALENLTADELKKFKMKLLSVPLREGYGRIPRGTLLTMDAMDLTDKLVSFYLEAYGAELTELVLRDMGMQETAERLQEIACKGEHTPSTPGRGPDAPPPPHPGPPPVSSHPHTPNLNVCPLGSFASCSSSPLRKAPPARRGSFPLLVLTFASGPRGL